MRRVLVGLAAAGVSAAAVAGCGGGSSAMDAFYGQVDRHVQVYSHKWVEDDALPLVCEGLSSGTSWPVMKVKAYAAGASEYQVKVLRAVFEAADETGVCPGRSR